MNKEAESLTSNDLIAVSRLLSKFLRHEPQMVGIRLDMQGWVAVTTVHFDGSQQEFAMADRGGYLESEEEIMT